MTFSGKFQNGIFLEYSLASLRSFEARLQMLFLICGCGLYAAWEVHISNWILTSYKKASKIFFLQIYSIFILVHN